MPQIIEWTSAGADDIVWRYPIEDITWGAQLIVHEYEVAAFFRDGKAYDTFGAGRHTLTTLNLPLLTTLLSRISGFQKTPFKANVIFISTKQFAGKFGNRAQTNELAPLMTFGSFWFKVEDASLFVNEVVGGQNAYSTPDVNNFLRGFINEKMIDVLSKYDLQTVFTKLDETSNEVKANLADYFKRLGVQMVDLKFEGIDTTPEFRDRLFWLKSGRISAGRGHPHGNGEGSGEGTGQIHWGRGSLWCRYGARPTTFPNFEWRRWNVSSARCLPELSGAYTFNLKVLSKLRTEHRRRPNPTQQCPGQQVSEV